VSEPIKMEENRPSVKVELQVNKHKTAVAGRSRRDGACQNPTGIYCVKKLQSRL